MRKMNPGLLAFALGLGLLLPAQAVEGRWEGRAELPGQAVPVVLDLQRQGSTWTGLATLPGRGVALAPLQALSVAEDGRWRASLVLGSGGAPGAEVNLELQPAPDGRSLQGRWRQAGHDAPLRLEHRGSPQRPVQVSASALAPALAGTWRGHYDIGFGKREVALRITPPTAAMTIVGRRTFELSFDEVRQHGGLLLLRAVEPDITVEASWDSAARGELAATWFQGPFESLLPLRREVGP